MKNRGWMGVVLAVAVGAGGALLLPLEAGAGKTAGRDGPAETAAREFLDSLPADLKRKSAFAFDAPERTTWNFVPMDRAGVSMLELDDAQSEKLGPLLGSALSDEGLVAARGVIKHENILRRVETERGMDATRRDPGRYYTAIFGTPSGAAPWGWRFEGHHLSINVTQLPGRPPAVGPLFVGANPAKVLSGAREGFRLLAAEEDLGRALVTMLAPERRKIAVFNDIAFAEIVTGNDPKARPLEKEGLEAAAMSPEERAALRRLIDLYIDRLAPESARDVRKRLRNAGLGQLRFGWAGSLVPGEKHYYRVHGPTLLIEYDNTQNDANHIHTVYRDLDRDFGGDALRAHLSKP